MLFHRSKRLQCWLSISLPIVLNALFIYFQVPRHLSWKVRNSFCQLNIMSYAIDVCYQQQLELRCALNILESEGYNVTVINIHSYVCPI